METPLEEQVLTEARKKIPTVEELSAMLQKEGLIKKGFKRGKPEENWKGFKVVPIVGREGVSAETYGRKTMLYIRLRDMAEREAFEHFFSWNDLNYNPRYSKGYPIVEVQVKNFKASNWYE